MFTQKVSGSSEKHLIGNSLREIEDASNELQRQVGDFDRAVEEYKQNLEMNVKLQQALEEVRSNIFILIPVGWKKRLPLNSLQRLGSS